MKSNISAQLKNLRLLNNLSQSEVANYLSISASAYSHYESGKREPNVAALTKLAELYHLEDQILGVHQYELPKPLPRTYTVTQFFEDINSHCPEYSLPKKINMGKTLALTSGQYDALCDFFKKLANYKKVLFNEIASSNDGNDGKMYEALVYTWLELQGIQFSPQKKIDASNCLRANDYIADGIINDEVIFDVKRFGIVHPNISLLQQKFNEMNENALHNDYIITISGSIDLSNDELESLLRKTSALYKTLFSDSNRLYTDYCYTIPKTDLTIRAHNKRNQSMFTSISEYNPYKWAMQNQYYFFHHASQFCTHTPFMLICPYDIQSGIPFTNKASTPTMTAFRSLCRRIFLGMPENIDVCLKDEKCPPLISLKAASECISAILFLDVSTFSRNAPAWLYINPNARHKLRGYIKNQFRNHLGCIIDEFEFDNY